MNGFNIAEAGHVVVVLAPKSITGGATAQAFSMKNYRHASIIIAIGAEATQDTSTLVLNLCSDASGDNAVAIPFNYYYQAAGGAGNDTLVGNTSVQAAPGVGPVNATSSGITLSASNFPANGCIVIEIDDAELEAAVSGNALSGTDGIYSYLQVVLGAPSAADYAAIVVILSGSRYAGEGSPSVTV